MELLNFDNLSRIEKNERKPGIDIVLSIANFFDVSIDWLLTGEGDDVNRHQEHINPSDLEFLAKLHQLSDIERARVEGIIEGILLSKGAEGGKRESLLKSKNGDERAASKAGA